VKQPHASSKIYYGWIIVAVSMISTTFWFGIRTSFSVFYVPLLEQFHWNRGESAGVQSVALLSYTFLAPVVGGLIDRFGPRRVIVPGIFLFSFGLALSSRLESLLQFYVFYGIVMGSGITCIGIVSYSAILAHWFEKKRGLASGIAVSGMGLGTFLFVPLSQHLISAYGWRDTFIIQSVLALVILLPLNFFWLRHTPHDLGLLPDGRKEDPFENSVLRPVQGEEKAVSLGRIMRTKSFWHLLIFPSLAVVGVYVVLVHNVRFLIDKGISPMSAALIFAVAGGISSFFRIFWGYISDRIGREKTYTLGMISISLGALSLLLLDRVTGKVLVYSFMIFFGIGWGATAPMFMAAAADLFRGKVFGLVYGLVEGVIGIGAALGSWAAGFIFDVTHSYRFAFGLAIFVFALSGIFMWLAAPRKAKKSLP
jgi:MFS family permease